MIALISSKLSRIAVFFILGIVFATPVVRAGERVGEVEASVLPTPNKDKDSSGGIRGTSHGYVEYRVQLKNLSSKEQIVYLAYPAIDRWFGPITRTVRLAPKQDVLVPLYQPPLHIGIFGIGVRVEGVRDGKILPVTDLFEKRYRRDFALPPAVLLSRSVPQDLRDHMQAIIKSQTNPQPGNDPPDRFTLLRSELAVSQWSPNWLGYSCYDAILLTEREAEEMPAQAQLAIRRYVECGGTLFIHGQKIPAAFAAADPSGTIGLGRVTKTLDGKSKNDDWKATCKKLLAEPPHIYSPEDKPTGFRDLLEAETTVPVRGLFVVVLVFGVGIGPVNLWLLSRYKRRIWLWWNVPAISLLTCLVVFTYSIASEGFAGRGKTASFTLLDERCHRAATFGYISYYCPLTPSEGPRFSVDTDVALLKSQNQQPWEHHADDSSRYVDWTADQFLSSGWIVARVPTYFQFRKNEDRRERLTVERQADGSLKVVNALGAAIDRLYLADASGRVFEAKNIEAGGQVTLSPTNQIEAGRQKEIPPPNLKTPTAGNRFTPQGFFRGGWINGFQHVIDHKNPGELLAPGCYIAMLEKSPFVESPLAGVKPKETASIVYGILKDGK